MVRPIRPSITQSPRFAVRLVTGNSAATVQAGTVRINPSGSGIAPVAQAIFSLKSNGVTVNEAGVSALPTGTVFRMYAEASGALSRIGSIQTGVAIANPILGLCVCEISN